MPSKVITTERLTIRPIEMGDINAIHAYAGDPSINMMMFLPNETLADTKAFVDYSVSQWNMENPEDRPRKPAYSLQFLADAPQLPAGRATETRLKRPEYPPDAASADWRVLQQPQRGYCETSEGLL